MLTIYMDEQINKKAEKGSKIKRSSVRGYMVNNNSHVNQVDKINTLQTEHGRSTSQKQFDPLNNFIQRTTLKSLVEVLKLPPVDVL